MTKAAVEKTNPIQADTNKLEKVWEGKNNTHWQYWLDDERLKDYNFDDGRMVWTNTPIRPGDLVFISGPFLHFVGYVDSGITLV